MADKKKYATVSQLAQEYNAKINTLYVFLKRNKKVQIKTEEVVVKRIFVDRESFKKEWLSKKYRKTIEIFFLKHVAEKDKVNRNQSFITEKFDGSKSNVLDYERIQNEKTLAYMLTKTFGSNIRAKIMKTELDIDYEILKEELRKIGWVIT